MANTNETKKTVKTLEGVVVSNKMKQTVVIKVTRTFRHPKIGKIISKAKNYKVHDKDQVAKVGDLIEAVECRPISKTKHMTLSRIVKQAQ